MVGNQPDSSFGTRSVKTETIHILDAMDGAWEAVYQAALFVQSNGNYTGCLLQANGGTFSLPERIASNNAVGAGSGGILTPGGST